MVQAKKMEAAMKFHHQFYSIALLFITQELQNKDTKGGIYSTTPCDYLKKKNFDF